MKMLWMDNNRLWQCALDIILACVPLRLSPPPHLFSLLKGENVELALSRRQECSRDASDDVQNDSWRDEMDIRSNLILKIRKYYVKVKKIFGK